MRSLSSTRCGRRSRSSRSGPGTGMVIPRRKRSRPTVASRRSGPITTGRWRSRSMAQASPPARTRMVFLLHGEDPFRTRLRVGELVESLLAGHGGASGDLSSRPLPRLGDLIGLVRLDARTDEPGAIAMAGQSQGLFAAPDERRIVLVDHAEALAKSDFLTAFPDD